MDRLNALAAHIRNQGGKVVPVLADITDEAQANEIIHRAQQEVGRVNILVNNAGLVLFGLIDGVNTEDWRRMVNVNILGSLYTTTHAALPLHKWQRSRRIVSISSVIERTRPSVPRHFQQ